jgi:hypothetical protein
MRSRYCSLILLLASSVACAAQGLSPKFDLAGTWYGGSDTSAKYLLTITPIGPGHYLLRYDEGFTAAIPKLSEWSGEMTWIKGDTYVAQMLALANPSNVPPNQGGPNPQIWAARELVRLINPTTLEAEIDFYGVYAWGKIPFIDSPDGSRLPPSGTIKETYQRISDHCTACNTDAVE